VGDTPEHRILVVDDERNIRRVLQALLEGDGYAVDAASDGDEARAKIRKARPPYDVVLSDLRMPNCDGLQLLRWAAAHQPDTPVVMLTAHGTVDTAVQAMREGAFDFITKPFEEADLQEVIGKALAHREANRSRAYQPLDGDDDSSWRPVDPDRATEVLSSIVGVSPPMQQVFATMRKVAPSPTNILIRGESGTGKELVANAIHRLSDRHAGPFVAVNCTAIPESLFESELFGHEKGAFTGAHKARPGRFELADGGTIFLDEIGELPLAMQVKLLRVLQERTLERVGGTRTQTIDVRLVAATNAPLEAMVEQGSFREDLFYRLNVVPVSLPPLRDRPDDIPVLAEHFLEKFCLRMGRPPLALGEAARDAIMGLPWPGNIRQLENIMERLVLLAEGDTIDLSDLPAELGGSPAATPVPAPPGVDTVRDEPMPEGKLKDIVKSHTQQLERDLIARALDQDGWNVTHAARRLGLSRKGLQLKMKDLGLRQTEAET